LEFKYILLGGSGLLLIIFLYDIFQRKHAILRNFPVLGHVRYLMEKIGPELRQYWVANDKEEMPFTRAERTWIYATSKMQNNNFGFGSSELMYEAGYPVLKHSAFPTRDKYDADGKLLNSSMPCAKLIGAAHNRKNPYRPQSIVNISAMSFGSLGKNAISVLS
jgi:glutamate synthase (ferredoxin)